MSLPWFTRLLPAALQFRQALTAHHAGRLAGRFTLMPAETPRAPDRKPLRIHFWTPYSWSSTAIHVERVMPELRGQAIAADLPWRIAFGPRLPQTPVDWLLCLKAVPPKGLCPAERTVLLLTTTRIASGGGWTVSVTSFRFLLRCWPRCWGLFTRACGLPRRRNPQTPFSVAKPPSARRRHRNERRCCCGTVNVSASTACAGYGRCWKRSARKLERNLSS